MLKIQICCLLIVALAALEVTVIGGDLPGGDREVNSLKLSINSNGRYVYPSQDKHTFAVFQL